MDKKVLSTKRITVVGVLTALIIVLGLSGLGIIEIPGLPFRITILHIPVIIGAVLEGPIVGAIIGLLFGIWSIIDKVMRPPINGTGFIFMNPIVSVLPRILIGIFSYYSYIAIKKLLPESLSIVVSSVIGSFTNTILVLGAIYIIYAEQYMNILGKAKETALYVLASVAGTVGVGEAVASAVLVPIIVLGIKKIRKSQ